MKNLLRYFGIALFLFVSIKSNSQNCTVNAGIPQTICANGTLTLQGQTNGSFPGGIATITWSQVSGTPTSITSPSSANTTVTGFSAGTYVYQISTTCLDGSNITDNVTITVRPVVMANAGVDATYCPGTYTLSANSPSPGTGTWTTVGTNYGVTVSTTNSPTSNIVLSATNSGNTTLRWTITQTTSGTSCTSYDDVVITNRGGVSAVNAGADITLSNCYTTTHSTTLAASYGGTNIGGQQGTWSQISGPNTASFSNVNANNATASNLIQGTYVFRWTVAGPCVNGFDDVQVIVPAPTSSLTSIGTMNTQYFCDGRTSTVLTATQPSFAGETASWLLISGAGTFSNPSDYSTTVSGMNSGSNTYRYRITNASGCTAFRDIIVNNVSAPTLAITTVSPVLVNCGVSSTVINFTASGGTGTTQYRVIAGPAGYSLPGSWTNAGASNFTVSGLNYPGTYLVRVMRVGTNDCNAVTQDITVIVSQTPTLSNAGTDQLLACNITQTALAGNIPATGAGSWSQVSGPNTAIITNPSLYNTTITGLVPGAYNFKWIINAGNGCTPSEDIVIVRVANVAPTTANAGADLNNICHTGPVQLDGNAPVLNEIGTWTASPSAGISFSNANDPKAIVTGMAANTTYTFTWTIVNSCGSSSDDKVVTTIGTQGAGQANAGIDQCLSAATTSITMAASPASPIGTTGTWSLVSGPNTPTITNINSPTTTITGATQGTYVFAWSLNASGCGLVSDTVVTTISPTLTTANAGSAQTICSSATTLAGNNPSTGTGTWSQISGPGGVTIVNPVANNSDVNGLSPGLFKFRWTISSGACSNYSDVLVTVSTLPTSASVAADSICLIRTTLNSMTGNAPTNGIGTWTQISGPNVATITTASSPTSGLTGLINGNYIFRWTISGGTGCASSSADMNVSVNMPTSVLNNVNVCNVTSATLIGNANIGGVWSQTTGPATSIIQPVLPNIGAVTNLQPGTYTFQFTPNAVAGCAALTPRTVTFNNNAPATASTAGINQSLCGVTSFSLSANTPMVGTGAWSRVSGPNTPAISSTSSLTPNITGATNGLYTYRWTITNGGCTSADDVTVLISAPATVANAGSNQIVCSNVATASLNANAPVVGTGVWNQVSGPVITSFSNASSNTSLVNGLILPGNYTFRWTIANGACSNNSQTIVQVDEAPASSAGANATVYGTSCNLLATQPTVGTGAWSQVLGPVSTITDVNAYNTSVTGLQIGNSYTYRWTVTNGTTCAAATSDVVLNVSAILPATLTSFAGQIQSGTSYLLWKVANEREVSYFEVERSNNGINFFRVATVASSVSNGNYSYQEPYPAGLSTCYYRLRTFDKNGQFRYSSIVRLSAKDFSPAIIITPNPAKGNIVVRLEYNRIEDAILSVANSAGQIICRQDITLQAGSQTFTLPGLTPGVYKVVVKTSSGVQLKTTALIIK